MDNEYLIKVLRFLRNDGILYKKIAIDCNIQPSSFYSYMRIGKFPLTERERIISYLDKNYGEVLHNAFEFI